MVQTDEKILSYSDKKNSVFVIKDTRKSAFIISSIMVYNFGEVCELRTWTDKAAAVIIVYEGNAMTWNVL
jgi:hypothetical protein